MSQQTCRRSVKLQDVFCCHLFWIVLALGAAVLALPVIGQPMAPSAERGEGGDSTECEDGVVLDDGTAETGYGWVPSVIEGEYVQEFDSADFSSRRIQSVCICWLRTRPDATIDFELVFYSQIIDPEDKEGKRLIPAPEPYAVIPADAEVIPKGVTESFFEVRVGDLAIPNGRSYIGARWNPSLDSFFFICADHSEGTEEVDVFFRDDRSEDGEWGSALESSDPIFANHKAIMIRPVPNVPLVVDVPTLGTTELMVLTLTLAALGWVMLRRSGRLWP